MEPLTTHTHTTGLLRLALLDVDGLWLLPVTAATVSTTIPAPIATTAVPASPSKGSTTRRAVLASEQATEEA